MVTFVKLRAAKLTCSFNANHSACLSPAANEAHQRHAALRLITCWPLILSSDCAALSTVKLTPATHTEASNRCRRAPGGSEGGRGLVVVGAKAPVRYFAGKQVACYILASMLALGKQGAGSTALTAHCGDDRAANASIHARLSIGSAPVNFAEKVWRAAAPVSSTLDPEQAMVASCTPPVGDPVMLTRQVEACAVAS